MGFQHKPLKGKANPKWRGGKTINHDGYVIISAGPFRGTREHRLVSDQNLKKHWGRGLLPEEEVHHMDFKRGHNCPSNLLICGPGLHEAFTCLHAIKVRSGRYKAKPILELIAAAEVGAD